MKTFKLKSLEIMENKNKNIIGNKIPLLDGLIINREDEESNWLIESYVDQSHFEYFNTLREQDSEIMVEVKITKESNEPAIFIASVIGVNKISDKMNVLLMGKIIDQEKIKVEKILNELISEGYHDHDLVEKLKEVF